MTNTTMTMYRIFAHLWTPKGGHADKAFKMNGTDLTHALKRLDRAVIAKYGADAQVHLRAYEVVTPAPGHNPEVCEAEADASPALHSGTCPVWATHHNLNA